MPRITLKKLVAWTDPHKIH